MPFQEPLGFSHDDQSIVTWEPATETIRFWNVSSGREIQCITDLTELIPNSCFLHFTEIGRWVVFKSSDDREVQVSLNAGQTVRPTEVPRPPLTMGPRNGTLRGPGCEVIRGWPYTRLKSGVRIWGGMGDPWSFKLEGNVATASLIPASSSRGGRFTSLDGSKALLRENPTAWTLFPRLQGVPLWEVTESPARSLVLMNAPQSTVAWQGQFQGFVVEKGVLSPIGERIAAEIYRDAE